MPDDNDRRDESESQPEEHQATQRGEQWESQEEDAQSTIDDVQEPDEGRGGDVQIEGEQYGEADAGQPGTPTADEQTHLDENHNQYGGGDGEDAPDQTRRRRDEERPMEQGEADEE